jgi:hypothetical protein
MDLGSVTSPKCNSQFLDGGGSSTLDGLTGLNSSFTYNSLNKSTNPPATTHVPSKMTIFDP